jgi:opacity protein-like surface antigen
MMHRIVLALVFVAGIAGATAAELHWNGAGWYGVADAIEFGWIETGPYADKASCDASLPADDEEVEYYCEYLATKPAWD